MFIFLLFDCNMLFINSKSSIIHLSNSIIMSECASLENSGSIMKGYHWWTQQHLWLQKSFDKCSSWLPNKHGNVMYICIILYFEFNKKVFWHLVKTNQYHTVFTGHLVLRLYLVGKIRGGRKKTNILYKKV